MKNMKIINRYLWLLFLTMKNYIYMLISNIPSICIKEEINGINIPQRKEENKYWM